jgi:hypothetical protein
MAPGETRVEITAIGRMKPEQAAKFLALAQAEGKDVVERRSKNVEAKPKTGEAPEPVSSMAKVQQSAEAAALVAAAQKGTPLVEQCKVCR